jgi:hypothetical protein
MLIVMGPLRLIEARDLFPLTTFLGFRTKSSSSGLRVIRARCRHWSRFTLGSAESPDLPMLAFSRIRAARIKEQRF